MSLIEHAKRELELIDAFGEGDFYGGMTGDAVMELITKFSDQGHSGMSAGIVVSLFEKLARYKPLSPITGFEEEWADVEEDVYQNKRLSSLFKNKKAGSCYYIDAIVWKEPGGAGFIGTVEGISSSQYVDFPFIPKTFYVSVEEDGEDYVIADQKALEEALAYYRQNN